MSDEVSRAYILRIGREEIERQLYLRRWVYVGVKREWSARSKILLLRRTDAFIGSGVVERLVGADELGETEKKHCLQNNWYAKVLFGKLAMFLPPILLSDTTVARCNPLTLHGLEIQAAEFLKIESMARCRIIT